MAQGFFSRSGLAPLKLKVYRKAKYQRLVSRRGKKRGALAVGHNILIIAYHIIKEQCVYKELGVIFSDV